VIAGAAHPIRLALRGAALAAGLLVVLALPSAADHGAVTIEDNRFAPSDITITQGDVVTWSYAGSVAHNITLEDGSYRSRDLASDGSTDTISFQFDATGTFLYHCTYHATCESGQCSGDMWAAVTVQPVAVEPGPEESGAPTSGADPEGDELPVTGGASWAVPALALLMAGTIIRRRLRAT
jgi:plastocyanin